MTDLEIVKKCAEKMGYVWCDSDFEYKTAVANGYRPAAGSNYDPLHDDAQAMALVKKFGLIIEPDGVMPTTEWWVQVWVSDEIRWTGVANKDLNRAICECVAKL